MPEGVTSRYDNQHNSYARQEASLFLCLLGTFHLGHQAFPTTKLPNFEEQFLREDAESLPGQFHQEFTSQILSTPPMFQGCEGTGYNGCHTIMAPVLMEPTFW